VPRRKTPRTLAAVILAAGEGKRLKSDLPKPLHPIAGRPVLWHVLHAADALRPDRLIVVVGKGKERVMEDVATYGLRSPVTFVEQSPLLGTGHAVMVAEEAVGRVSDVVVLPGDEPLVTGEQLRNLLSVHRRRDVAAVVQTTIPDDPRGYGRFIRDARGDFVKIAEGTDATPEELAVTEVATAVFAFRREDLFRALPRVDRDNKQREYYLPDVLGILREKGEKIAVQLVDNGGSVGANSRSELARAATVMRRRVNEAHMARGVTIVDPESVHIDPGVRIARDATILPFTFLEGETRVGARAVVGPSVRLIDTSVGRDSEIQFAVARGARIGAGVSVGPFASLRPGTVLDEKSKAGTFVEIKNSRVGRGSKVPHLSYIGDADIGKDANIGAATVTVNYDGFEKHRTVIGDGAKVGSDTMLVAPVKVGKRAFTGAGSVISKDVPDGALGVERSEQVNVRGYADKREARARRSKTRSDRTKAPRKGSKS
jgi:bifunctional UDP-N-acetylglucosamine pyrophosphorylase/glucosamine-1-phosphate N-acetyltransferase